MRLLLLGIVGLGIAGCFWEGDGGGRGRGGAGGYHEERGSYHDEGGHHSDERR